MVMNTDTQTCLLHQRKKPHENRAKQNQPSVDKLERKDTNAKKKKKKEKSINGIEPNLQ